MLTCFYFLFQISNYNFHLHIYGCTQRKDSLAGVIRKTMPLAVFEYVKNLDVLCAEYLKGKLIPIVFDGGKDVSSRKLIAFGIGICKQVLNVFTFN